MPIPQPVDEKIVRSILRDQGHLAASADDLETSRNLYDAGLASLASVNVMLALEDAFDIEFPDRLLRKSTFESIDAIMAALRSVLPGERL